jgi:hypothetical protein
MLRWSALAFLGCSGEHWVVSSGDAGSPSLSADSEPMLAPTLDPSPTAPTFTGSSCPADPAERRAIEGCWPTRYVGLWSGFFRGDPKYEARNGAFESFPVSELQLRLAADTTGSLTFGDSPVRDAPSSAADPYLCAGAKPSEGCPAAQLLVEGFAYGLENLAISDAMSWPARVAGEEPISIGERFAFDISLGEPWRGWCAAQLSEVEPCQCSGECDAGPCFRPRLVSELTEGACEAAPENVACGWLAARAARPCTSEGCAARERALNLALQMSEDGQSLRGEYLPSRVDLPVSYLEFTRLE